SRCVDTSATAHVPVAAVADRAEPLCSTTTSRRACVWGGGSRPLTHRGVGPVRSPRGPTGAAQRGLRLGRPSSLGWFLERLIGSNRRVRTRTHGGVGGVEPQGSPLSRSTCSSSALARPNPLLRARLRALTPAHFRLLNIACQAQSRFFLGQ